MNDGTNASCLGDHVARLAVWGVVRRTPHVGAKVSDFSLPNARATTRLSTLLATSPVVVTFYCGGWCSVCDLQLRAYERALPEIRRLGAEVVAISPQTPTFASADVEDKKLSFPALSDAHNYVARQYGLVCDPSVVPKEPQRGFGYPLPKFNGDDSWELPMPATFVIEQAGSVQFAHVDPDHTRRLEPAAILEALGRVLR